VVAHEIKITQRAARDRRHRRNHAQRFLERIFRQLELIEVGKGDVRSGWSYRKTLLAQLLLPLGMLGEIPDHRRDRRGDGVMRGHHQEVHVVDQLAVGHIFAVLAP
jgi:hypothetical protein